MSAIVQLRSVVVGDLSMQMKLQSTNFGAFLENGKFLQVSVMVTGLLCRIPSPQRTQPGRGYHCYATLTSIWAPLRPSPQCGMW